LAVLLGPLARAGGYTARLAQTQMVRLAAKPVGMTGPCTFQAVNNALAISKGYPKNLILTVKEAAKVKLVDPSALSKLANGKVKLGAWIEDLIPYLRTMGVRIRDLGPMKSLDDVVRAAQTQDGVVIFAIRWTDTLGKGHLHTMMAVKTVKGVQYCDYGGKFISNLGELAKRGGIWAPTAEGFNIGLPLTKGAVAGSSALVEAMKWTRVMEEFGAQAWTRGMYLLAGAQLVETVEGGVDVGVPVLPVAAVDKSEVAPEILKKSFEAFKTRMNGKKLMRMDPIEIKGDRNGPPPAVRLLTGVQYRLNLLGFGAGPVDGIMGPRTLAATVAFQKYAELRQDGIPGPKTQSRLTELSGF
jgi:hypothetical protein